MINETTLPASLQLEPTAALDVRMRAIETELQGEPTDSTRRRVLTSRLSALWQETVEECHDETSGRDLLGC